MDKKTLRQTNPYLQNITIRKALIARSVETSCGVEGIKISLIQARSRSAQFDIPHRGAKRIFQKKAK
jgi:hypothetical protein